MNVANINNHFHQPVTRNCRILETQNDLINLKNTLKLAFCLKLYENFGCRGFYKHHKALQDEEQLKTIHSYEVCENEQSRKPRNVVNETMSLEDKLVKIEDANNGSYSINDYILMLRNKSVDELGTGTLKREYNFLCLFFTHFMPKYAKDFNIEVPSWDTDWKNADWNFFPEFREEYLNDQKIVPHVWVMLEIAHYFNNTLTVQNPFGSLLKEKTEAIYDTVTELACYSDAFYLKFKTDVKNVRTLDSMILEFRSCIWGAIQEVTYSLAKQYGSKIEERKMTLYKRMIL